jgi:hypothetical protein
MQHPAALLAQVVPALLVVETLLRLRARTLQGLLAQLVPHLDEKSVECSLTPVVGIRAGRCTEHRRDGGEKEERKRRQSNIGRTQFKRVIWRGRAAALRCTHTRAAGDT